MSITTTVPENHSKVNIQVKYLWLLRDVSSLGFSRENEQERQIDFHRLWWLFNSEDDNSHDPTPLHGVIRLCLLSLCLYILCFYGAAVCQGARSVSSLYCHVRPGFLSRYWPEPGWAAEPTLYHRHLFNVLIMSAAAPKRQTNKTVFWLNGPHCLSPMSHTQLPMQHAANNWHQKSASVESIQNI